MAATAVRWQPLGSIPFGGSRSNKMNRRRFEMVSVKAFGRRDMDSFAKRMASGEAWKDAWRTANDGFERFLFEAKKTAERIDRRYAVSERVSSVARSAAERAREIDRDFEIGIRWRSFTIDFSRNWPNVTISLSIFLFFISFSCL